MAGRGPGVAVAVDALPGVRLLGPAPARLADAASGLRPRSPRQPDLPPQPGGLRCGVGGDVHLRFPVRPVRCRARSHRCDRVHHLGVAPRPAAGGRRPGQGGGDLERHDGLVVGKRRRQHRQHGDLHHSDDEERRTERQGLSRSGGGGQLGRCAGAAGDGGGRLHDAGNHRSARHLSRDHPRRPDSGDPLLPVALSDRPLLRTSHPGRDSEAGTTRRLLGALGGDRLSGRPGIAGGPSGRRLHGLPRRQRGHLGRHRSGGSQ